MKSLYTLTFLAILTHLTVFSQESGQIFGLNFTDSSLRLATVNPENGDVEVISETEMSGDEFGSGNSDINPIDGYYHYVRFGQIITADLNTGEVVYDPSLFCETQAISPVQGISNIAYNWIDSTLYGLVHYDEELSFAKVDFISGEITIISDGPISSDQYYSGVSDIDPIGGRYFYLRTNRIITIDIETGEVLDNEPMFNPNDAVLPITNIAYDWLSDVVYGLNFVGSEWDNNGNETASAQLRLAAINPTTGFVAVLSEAPLSPDEFSNGVSDIDPVNQKYYYIRANRIYSVDIVTGELSISSSLSNPNNAISPITNIGVFKDKDSQPAPIANFEDHSNENEFWFKNVSEYAREVFWDFGDGETSEKRHPEHSYQEPGTYEVTLTVTSLSGEEHSYTKIITVDGILSVSASDESMFRVYPNPAMNELFIDLAEVSESASIEFYDLNGRLVLRRDIKDGNSSKVDISSLDSGLYTLLLSKEGEVYKRRIVVE